MALSKASYNKGGPAIPAPGGDYSAPTPHAANSSHQVFQAPSDNSAAQSNMPSGGAGLDAISQAPKATRPAGGKPTAPIAAQAFNPRPSEWP